MKRRSTNAPCATARHGRAPAPYTKAKKSPYRYPWQHRLASGELAVTANQSEGNVYRR